MKLLCIVLWLSIGATVNAQSPAEQVADRIAQRMKDTLMLSDTQRVQIYQINLQLDQEKLTVRNQYAGSDSLRIKIQRVENTRDGLYQAILSEDNYRLYKLKKRSLVNNN